MSVGYKFEAIIAICALILFQRCSAQVRPNDIALHKHYILSASPNYDGTAPATDVSSLTDGVYTSFHFWSASTTVGWKNVNPLKITIDLEKDQPIGNVIFNTARNAAAGVDYPANIFVFISHDNQNFVYAGDAAQSPQNTDGGYMVNKFELTDINISGRYVMLQIVAKRSFIFCDEIEILSGKAGDKVKRKLISKENLPDVTDSLKRFKYDQENLRKNLNRLEQNIGSASMSSDLVRMNTLLENKKLTPSDLNGINDNLRQLHSADLRKKYQTAFVVEKYNPWDTLQLIHTPTTSQPGLNYQYKLPANGVQYGAFIITNNGPDKRTFLLSGSTNTIELYKAPFAPLMNYGQAIDPLLPLKESVSILPGESQMFIFKVTGKIAGTVNSIITINSANNKFIINVTTVVRDLFSGRTFDDLNTVNWADLNYNMLSDRKQSAINDLKAHHINTIVISPPAIPKMSANADFGPLRDYLTQFKGTKNILLYVNFHAPVNRITDNKAAYLSDDWKKSFVQWYARILATAKSIGFSPKQIYLYPYDEVRDNEIDDFKNLALWLKREVPEVQLYATLGNSHSVDVMLGYLDVAQILLDKDIYKNLPDHKAQIWLYATKGATRSLSPYSYYRLISWTAFVNGIKGVGFWNYADVGSGKKNLINAVPYSDYAVIYDGPGQEIISSRRWEAFKLGVEDYSLLNLYARKFGLEKAKQLAQKVIQSPDNIDLADDVRTQIINAL